MKKRYRQRLLNLIGDTYPCDVLIASHPYGPLVVPSSKNFSILEAILEIRRLYPSTKRVACCPDITHEEIVKNCEDPDVIIIWEYDHTLDTTHNKTTEFIRRITLQNLIDSRCLIFSGFLTSPWTIFQVSTHMIAPGACNAKRTLYDMAKNARALKHYACAQTLRQRLRGVLGACHRWVTPQTPMKATGFRGEFFPSEEGIDKSQAYLGLDSTHVMTKPSEADAITSLILSRTCKEVVITDCTANVGGNTLSFSKFFQKVQSVEIDPVYHKCLVHNVGLYKRSNVVCKLGDIVSLLPTLNQDIFFIDPPWGGTGYRMHQRINLYLSTRPLSEIIGKMLRRSRLVVVKAPLNWDLPGLFTKPPLYNMVGSGTIRFEIHNIRKFLLVFFFTT